MKKQPVDLQELLANLKDQEYCYFTTIGRVTGSPHEIEIWFGLNDTTLYLMSGDGKSDWVRNLKKNPSVTVRIAQRNFTATARIVNDEKEEMPARVMLADKYKERADDGELSEWARTALVIAIDIIQGA